MPFRRNNKYVAWGLTFLGVIVASIIMFVVFTNLKGFFAVIQKFISIISPFLYGLLFAYLMNPIMVRVELCMGKLLAERDLSPRAKRNLSRGVGVGVSCIVLLAVLYLLIYMIVPQIIESLNNLFDPQTIINYYQQLRKWILKLFQDNPDTEAWCMQRLEDVYKWVENWLKNLDLEAAFRSITTGVVSVVRAVVNLFIGLVAAVYMLLSKDTFYAQLKKIAVAFLREERCNRVFDVCTRTNKIFGGFIVGKLIDSLIIGILCYFGMLILKLPYPVLIAAIVGVTNIIPFFGPIIGLVPSALLILLINPWQCLYFVIFVLCLQQFDGNILGPHILGDSVGLSSFWILVSITVAGGIFGFAGMVLGVPCFAVFYSLFSDWVNRKLCKKGCPAQTACYGKIKCVSDLERPVKKPAPPADLTKAAAVLDLDDEVEIESAPADAAAADTPEYDFDCDFAGLD